MTRRIARLTAITGVALAAMFATVAPALAAAPSPAQVRECVERNLPRYENPGSAVVAQYSDAETTCRAMLEEGAVTAGFVPSESVDRGSDVRASSGGGGEGGGQTEPRPTPTGGQATAPQEANDGRTAPRDTARSASPKPRDVPSVARAIEGGDGAGTPIPSSLAAGPIWLYALLGAIAVGIGAAALRRRPR